KTTSTSYFSVAMHTTKPISSSTSMKPEELVSTHNNKRWNTLVLESRWAVTDPNSVPLLEETMLKKVSTHLRT
nr:hypothetical protein [Escherichia coli]